MASKKISQMDLLSEVSGNSLFPVVQSGNNYAIVANTSITGRNFKISLHDV